MSKEPGVSSAAASDVTAICARYENDRHRMLDILLGVQQVRRCITPESMDIIARQVGLTRIAVEGVASFYSFLSLVPKGRVTIRLCDDIVDRFAGLHWHPCAGGAPLLHGCCASFEVANEVAHAGGDHTIFVGRVEKFSETPGKPPLLFHGGQYRALIEH